MRDLLGSSMTKNRIDIMDRTSRLHAVLFCNQEAPTKALVIQDSLLFEYLSTWQFPVYDRKISNLDMQRYYVLREGTNCR